MKYAADPDFVAEALAKLKAAKPGHVTEPTITLTVDPSSPGHDDTIIPLIRFDAGPRELQFTPGDPGADTVELKRYETVDGRLVEAKRPVTLVGCVGPTGVPHGGSWGLDGRGCTRCGASDAVVERDRRAHKKSLGGVERIEDPVAALMDNAAAAASYEMEAGNGERMAAYNTLLLIEILKALRK